MNVHAGSQPLADAILQHFLTNVLTHGVGQVGVPGLGDHGAHGVSGAVLIVFVAVQAGVALGDTQTGRAVSIGHGGDSLAGSIQASSLTSGTVDVHAVDVVSHVLASSIGAGGLAAGGLSVCVGGLAAAFHDVSHLDGGQTGNELFDGDFAFSNVLQGSAAVVSHGFGLFGHGVAVSVEVHGVDGVLGAGGIVITLGADEGFIGGSRHITGHGAVACNALFLIGVLGYDVSSLQGQLGSTFGAGSLQAVGLVVFSLEFIGELVVVLDVALGGGVVIVAGRTAGIHTATVQGHLVLQLLGDGFRIQGDHSGGHGIAGAVAHAHGVVACFQDVSSLVLGVGGHFGGLVADGQGLGCAGGQFIGLAVGSQFLIGLLQRSVRSGEVHLHNFLAGHVAGVGHSGLHGHVGGIGSDFVHLDVEAGVAQAVAEGIQHSVSLVGIEVTIAHENIFGVELDLIRPRIFCIDVAEVLGRRPVVDALGPGVNQLTGGVGFAIQHADDGVAAQLTGVGDQHQCVCAGLCEPAGVDVDNVEQHNHLVEGCGQGLDVGQLVGSQLVVVLDVTVSTFTGVPADGVEGGVSLSGQCLQCIFREHVGQCGIICQVGLAHAQAGGVVGIGFVQCHQIILGQHVITCVGEAVQNGSSDRFAFHHGAVSINNTVVHSAGTGAALGGLDGANAKQSHLAFLGKGQGTVVVLQQDNAFLGDLHRGLCVVDFSLGYFRGCLRIALCEGCRHTRQCEHGRQCNRDNHLSPFLHGILLSCPQNTVIHTDCASLCLW